MKPLFILLSLTLSSLMAQAQLKPFDKVFLKFEQVEGKESVNPESATKTLKDYLEGKTTLAIVPEKETADYIILLSVVIMKNKRMAKITMIEIKSNNTIFESSWMKGNGSTMMYHYSGTKMAVGKLVKGEFLNHFPEIKQ